MSRQSQVNIVRFDRSLRENGQCRGFTPASPAQHPNGRSLTSSPARDQRSRLWELDGSLHCSIIGTCLSTAELRKILEKAGLATAGKTEYDLHETGVNLASKRDAAAKILNKMLDDLHRPAIKRYGQVTAGSELLTLWQEDVNSGDLPGGYWAVLTHPAATPAVVREAFGDIHMLSHLVGATNHADIRRLQKLEERNAALEAKVHRQQDQLRYAITSRDAEIRELREALSVDIASDDGTAQETNEGQFILRKLVGELERRLDMEFRRRTAAEQRIAKVRTEAAAAREAALAAERRVKALQEELDAVERSLQAPNGGVVTAAHRDVLGGLTVLYVGGRSAQIPHIRKLTVQYGGELLHHDCGIEDSGPILTRMVSRADMVLFPTECVSHNAISTLKRVCRAIGKPYMPLRSAAITSFIAALNPER